MPWEWNSTAAEFHNTDTGERLPLEDVEDLVDQIIEEESDNVDDIIEIFLEGEEVDTRGWKLSFAVVIMDLYFILAVLGIGGVGRLTSMLSGVIEDKLRFQYRRLDIFAREIEAGQIPLGSIRQRMRMYVNSSRQAYWLMRDELELDRGRKQEQWITLGDTHVCNPCGEAGMEGWRPIGTFAQPGSGMVEISPPTMCLGLSSCRCRKEYR